MLVLKPGEVINSLELFCGTKKRTLILDCCRRIPRKIITEKKLFEVLGAAPSKFDADKCRRLYNKRIEECDPAIIIAYSCSIGQYSYDDISKRGGVYSLNLIKYARKWALTGDLASLRRNREYSILSIVKAHNGVIDNVKANTGDRQIPSIVKPRSGDYFPFGILV